MSDKYIRLKDGQDNIYPELYGIDVNNVLYEQYTNSGHEISYLATEDCIAMCTITNGNTSYFPFVYIDGVKLDSYDILPLKSLFLTLKKGQTLKTNAWITEITVYGLKLHS